MMNRNHHRVVRRYVEDNLGHIVNTTFKNKKSLVDNLNEAYIKSIQNSPGPTDPTWIDNETLLQMMQEPIILQVRSFYEGAKDKYGIEIQVSLWLVDVLTYSQLPINVQFEVIDEEKFTLFMLEFGGNA